MNEQTHPEPDQLLAPKHDEDVFISYSREDATEAERIQESLLKYQKEAWVDWTNIEPAGDWLETIKEGIVNAQVFVILISPHSMQSRVCVEEELRFAQRNQKKIIPVVIQDFEFQSDAPQTFKEAFRELERLNYIFLRQSDEFETGISNLCKAIDTDLNHVRIHTEYLRLARIWEHEEKAPSRLLRGKSLEQAEKWLSNIGATQPSASPIQIRFITHSRDVAKRRQKIGFGVGLLTLTVISVLAILSYALKLKADQNFKIAEDRRIEVEKSRLEEKTQRELAEKRQIETEIARQEEITQRNLAEKQTKVATEQTLRATLALAENDYELAHLNRLSGNYHKTFSYLSRCLKNNPDHRQAGALAWALVTTENIGIASAVCGLPSDRLDPNLPSGQEINRVASSFSKDGKRLFWLTKNGDILITDIENKTSKNQSRAAGKLDDWKFERFREEPSSVGGQIIVTVSDQNFSISELKKDAITIDKLEEETNQREELLASAEIVSEIGTLLEEAAEDLDTGDFGESFISHPYEEKFKTAYESFTQARHLEWKCFHPGSRWNGHAFVRPSGDLICLQAYPLGKSTFVKDADLLLNERTSYYEDPSFEWISLKEGRVGRFTGRVGTRIRYLVDSTSEVIYLNIDGRSFLLRTLDEDASSRNYMFSNLGSLHSDSLIEAVGIDNADAIFFDRGQNRVIAACGSEVRSISLAKRSVRIVESEDSTFDSFKFIPEIQGCYCIDSESDHLRHSEISLPLSQHGVLDGFYGAIYNVLPFRDAYKFVLISDTFDGRNLSTRLCLVSNDFRHVINRGMKNLSNGLSDSRCEVASTVFDETGYSKRQWLILPENSGNPSWLSSFLSQLIGFELSREGELVKFSGALKLEPLIQEGSDWSKLALSILQVNN